MMVRLTLYLAMAAALPEAVFPAQAHSTAGLTQMVTYVKRHPEWSRQDFWDYWQKQHAPKVVPLSTHFNITRYQQVRRPFHLPLSSPHLPVQTPPQTPMPTISFPDPSRRQGPTHRVRCRRPGL